MAGRVFWRRTLAVCSLLLKDEVMFLGELEDIEIKATGFFAVCCHAAGTDALQHGVSLSTAK